MQRDVPSRLLYKAVVPRHVLDTERPSSIFNTQRAQLLRQMPSEPTISLSQGIVFKKISLSDWLVVFRFDLEHYHLLLPCLNNSTCSNSNAADEVGGVERYRHCVNKTVIGQFSDLHLQSNRTGSFSSFFT